MPEPEYRLPSHVQLVHGGGSLTTQKARYVTLTTAMAREKIDEAWSNQRFETISKPQDQIDFHWRWRELASEAKRRGHLSVAIETQDGQLQAAVIYRPGFKSQLEEDSFSIFIDKLASAPQNRADLAQAPKFVGCGTSLLAYAAAHSYFLGQKGRLSLIAAANSDWYERRGFLRTATEIPDGVIYELPTDRAGELLNKHGLLHD